MNAPSKNCKRIHWPASCTSFIQTHDVITQVGATGRGHDLDSSQVFRYLDGDLADLQGQLTRGNQNHGWNNKTDKRWMVAMTEK